MTPMTPAINTFTPTNNTANLAADEVMTANITNPPNNGLCFLIPTIKCQIKTNTMFPIAMNGTKIQKGGITPNNIAMTGETAATVSPVFQEHTIVAMIRIKFTPVPVTSVPGIAFDIACQLTKSAINTADCVIHRIVLLILKFFMLLVYNKIHIIYVAYATKMGENYELFKIFRFGTVPWIG